jgi:hypothetical protein
MCNHARRDNTTIDTDNLGRDGDDRVYGSEGLEQYRTSNDGTCTGGRTLAFVAYTRSRVPLSGYGTRLGVDTSRLQMRYRMRCVRKIWNPYLHVRVDICESQKQCESLTFDEAYA